MVVKAVKISEAGNKEACNEDIIKALDLGGLLIAHPNKL
jgi:hypothetical protein